MFKGLKSKLEDQGKRLQASVAQYGEQISEQIGSMRTATSDAGSDAGSNITRRFLNAVGGGSSPNHPNLEDSLNHSLGSALMEEVAEADLLGLDIPKRERRWSGGSTHSNESSFSSFFQSVPGMAASTLEDIDSDREGTLDERGSEVVRSASKEQISSVLSKLQGRAANYKDKYRDLVKKYNEVVTENNKCRTVLAQTQDKALERMERLRNEKKELTERVKELEHDSPAKLQKYEQLLEKCKAEITKCKEKIKELTAENEGLRSWNDNADGDTGMSDLAAERISSEWKQRIDKVEGEWTDRLNKVESNYIDQIAAAKKDTFVMMESKDKEIESLRSKCRELEIQDGQANERWQKRVDELQAVVKALETEKTDMVEKLSAAKTQGVQAVRDEEAVKREELVAEWKQKVEGEEKKHQEAMEALKAQLDALETVQEEGQAAANASKVSEHNLEIQLAELEEKLRTAEARLSQQKEEMDAILENVNSKHRDEVADLIREHEELISLSKKQAEVERTNLTDMISFLEKDLEQVRSTNDKARKESDVQQQTTAEEFQLKEIKYKQEVESLQEEVAQLTKRYSAEMASVAEGHQKEARRLEQELAELKEELDRSALEAEESAEMSNTAKQESDSQLTEMRDVLQERNETVRRLELEKSELEVELSQSRELSSIHEHLRGELEEARKQKEKAEVKLCNLEKKAAEREKKHVEEEELVKLEVSAQDLTASEARDMKKQVASLEQQKHELEDKLTAVLAERDDLADKFTTTSDREEKTNKLHVEEVASLKASADEEKSHLAKRLESLQTETSQVIAGLTQRADEAEKHVSQQIKEKKQIEELLALTKEQLTTVTQELATTEEKQKADREDALVALQQQMDGLRQENEHLQSRVAESGEVEKLIVEKQKMVDELEFQYKTKLEEAQITIQEKEGQAEKYRNELEVVKGQIEQASETQKSTESAKIRELEELNERMRVEFIAKEKILTDLRTQLDAARQTADETYRKHNEELKKLQDELRRANLEMESAAGTVESLREALSNASELRKEDEQKWQTEKSEEIKIREQYSFALENLKSELADAQKKIDGLTKIAEEHLGLSEMISQLRNETQAKEDEFSKSKENADLEWKQKVEKAVRKQKKISEDEAAAARAELMLKIDGLHAEMAEKEKKVDTVVLEKARLEQEIIALTAAKEDLEQRKEKEKQLSTKLSEVEHRLMELEAENKIVCDRRAELEASKEQLATELERSNTLLAERDNEIKSLKDVNEEAMRKAAAKQDSDSKKVIRELQREVKQLYVELNEKSEAVDAMKKQLEQQKANSSEVAVKVRTGSMDAPPQKDFMYEEELEAMRRKLKDSHKEIDELKDLNSRLERGMENAKKAQMQKAPAPPKTNGTSASNYESSSFADPAEAEYLKNVLYRYMADRETLGHECVTLARVIGTVAKFNKSQLDSVVAREESRLAGWVGGTVQQMSNVLSGVRQ